MTRDRAHTVYGFAPQTPGGRVDTGSVSSDAVRDVLRDFHQPVALAASPLAIGTDPEERAESVRRLVRDVVARTFGHSKAEQALQRVVEIGYLDPAGGHAKAMHRLHLSRTTYFRRLREATDRLAAVLRDEIG